MINVTNVSKTTSKIRSVKKAGSELVYDFTVRDVHRINANGFYTSNCHHPEVRTFINIKRDMSKVTGANISLRLSDEFMNAVENGTDVELRFPVDSSNPIVSQMVDARKLWNEIIESAWASAEPGLLFWDTIKNMTPSDAYAEDGFTTISTNPCGELPLPAYDSCRLLLVNLTKFVVDRFEQTAKFDFESFGRAVQTAQKLMDDIVDLEIESIDKIINKIVNDPEPEHVKVVELSMWQEIREKAIKGRRTGLGLTGLGDAFAFMNVKYGSNESIDLTERIYKTLAVNAYTSSIKMAKDRGSFPIWSLAKESDHPFITRVVNELDEQTRQDYLLCGRRNIALTTTPPAGSTSILTQTTSGCEPAFLLSYKRRKKINPNDVAAVVDYVDNLGDMWQEFTVYHHGYAEWMKKTGLSDPALSPYAGSCSNDIDWLTKVNVQAAAQRWVCHSISNTTNIPNNATVDLVKDIYMHGWKTGCKGVTVYRDGCRAGVLVSASDEKPTSQRIVQTDAPKRPKELQCEIHRTSVQGEQYLVLVGLLDGKPYEIFAGLQEHVEVPRKVKTGVLIKNGKNGDGVVTYNLRIPIGDDDFLLFKDVVNLFNNPVHGAFTRTISLALRHGVPVNYLCEQLKKDKNSDITSFSSCIARVLGKSYIPDGTKSTLDKSCIECGGSNIKYAGGCPVCTDCGYTKC